MVPLRIWGKGMETKARIRQRMLALRDAMQIQEREGKSAKIMARVTETLW